jgi:hypothetical protein
VIDCVRHELARQQGERVWVAGVSELAVAAIPALPKEGAIELAGR